MSPSPQLLLSLCCLLAAVTGVAVADDGTQGDGTDGDGPNVTVEAPDTAVYNATSAFEAVVTDAEGSVSVRWEFPNGTTATGESATYRFEHEGNRTVTVVVTDDTGTTTERVTYDVFRYQRHGGPSQTLPGIAYLVVSVALMLVVVAAFVYVPPWLFANA